MEIFNIYVVRSHTIRGPQYPLLPPQLPCRHTSTLLTHPRYFYVRRGHQATAAPQHYPAAADRNPQDQGVRNSQAHVRTHQGSGSGGIESGSRGPRRHQSFHEVGLECFDRSTQIIKIIVLPLLYFSMLKYVDRSTHINELDLYIRGVSYRWG